MILSLTALSIFMLSISNWKPCPNLRRACNLSISAPKFNPDTNLSSCSVAFFISAENCAADISAFENPDEVSNNFPMNELNRLMPIETASPSPTGPASNDPKDLSASPDDPDSSLSLSYTVKSCSKEWATCATSGGITSNDRLIFNIEELALPVDVVTLSKCLST